MYHVHIESISVPHKISLFPKPPVPPAPSILSEISDNTVGRCVISPVNIRELQGAQALNWPHSGSKPSLVTNEHDIRQLIEPP